MVETVFEQLYPNQLLYRLHMGRKVKLYMRPAHIKRSGSKQYIQVGIPKQLCNENKPCNTYVIVVIPDDDRSSAGRTGTRKPVR